MIILAIETSCDETAIAVLETKRGKFRILSNIVASQIKTHAHWGGVVPNLAKREHQRNLPIVLKKALRKTGFAISNLQFPISKQILNSKSEIINSVFKKIDLIAVTIGPGLEPALWTGINFAQELAKKWKKPIIGINHLEGHIFSALLREENFEFRISNLEFPVIALLVSGGHTELILMKNWLDYKIIGRTLDDAAGEAFDKVAKMLGLSYPGGPIVAKLAEERVTAPFTLPRPMINSKNYDFSFSGLKTAVLYKLRDLNFNNLKPSVKLITKKQIAYEFRQAVIDVLISKTIRAAKEYKIKTIILGGGVTANQELRRQMSKAIQNQIPNSKFLIPNSEFTTDNAAMIALAAYFRTKKKPPNKLEARPEELKADGNLKLK